MRSSSEHELLILSKFGFVSSILLNLRIHAPRHLVEHTRDDLDPQGATLPIGGLIMSTPSISSMIFSQPAQMRHSHDHIALDLRGKIWTTSVAFLVSMLESTRDVVLRMFVSGIRILASQALRSCLLSSSAKMVP
jgi:hypothetical protein